MINLDTITLVLVDGCDPQQSSKALNICCKDINFGKVLLLSYHKPTNLTKNIEFIEINNLNWLQYNQFVIKQLNNYINTSHCLLIQTDGFIINPHLWDDNFLNYDYIGAPWNINANIKNRPDVVCEQVRNQNDPNLVGNGGFSLRSKKFLQVSATCPNDCNGAEDAFVCLNNSQWFTDKHKIKYAPVDVAYKFSQDPLKNKNSTFGFHGDRKKIDEYNI